MAAVPYVTLDDVCRNVQFQLEVSAGLAPVSALIEAYRIANAGFLSNPLSLDEINGTLRNLTGCVVATGTDMNCYPLGDATTQCFDLSGHPIP
jgi:hypothetical protein